jgi:hypothetical protein
VQNDLSVKVLTSTDFGLDFGKTSFTLPLYRFLALISPRHRLHTLVTFLQSIHPYVLTRSRATADRSFESTLVKFDIDFSSASDPP